MFRSIISKCSERLTSIQADLETDMLDKIYSEAVFSIDIYPTYGEMRSRGISEFQISKEEVDETVIIPINTSDYFKLKLPPHTNIEQEGLNDRLYRYYGGRIAQKAYLISNIWQKYTIEGDSSEQLSRIFKRSKDGFLVVFKIRNKYIATTIKEHHERRHV